MERRMPLLAAAIAALALLAWLAVRTPPPAAPSPFKDWPLSDGTTAPNGTPAPGPSTVPSTGPSSATKPVAPDASPVPTSNSADLPLPAPSTTRVDGYIEFPDHTWYPPLNGVTKAPPIAFHELAPFAKVVGRWRDPTGREWYLHENGVRSTTYRNAQGEDVGLVSKDMPTKPVLDDTAHK